MKRFFELTLFYIFLSTYLHSQILGNSIWRAHMPPNNSLVGYYKFFTNTMEFSQSGVTYTATSSITISANSMTIIDKPNFGCPVSDTGQYTFAFIGPDTVEFTAVNDPCSGRKNALQNFVWSRMTTTGLSSVTSEQSGMLQQNLPNPFSEKTLIRYNSTSTAKETFLVIHDPAGREVNRHLLEANSGSLEIPAGNLPPGLYLYSLVADGQVLVTRRLCVSGW